MAYNEKTASRLRERLAKEKNIRVEEKRAFGGLAFMVNDKMCINVSGENLMCRFDPDLQAEVEQKKGFQMMIMRGKEMSGYCYVIPDGFRTQKDLEYWVGLCLAFNDRAQSSKKKK